MIMSKNELQERYAAFIENATEEEQNVMEEMIRGWEGKREGQYYSFVGSWLQTNRNWKDDETYEVTIPLHKGLENPLSMVHGGVTATLLDSTMGGLANEITPEGKGSVTLEMKINYIKPGKGETLRCESKVISKSKSMIVTEGKVYNDDNQVIAFGSGTFYIINLK
ncbi:PaaI family thioesterase [Alteribacillus sp. YIM 98480]|uniref:PaaI family thioesterase n=1 Tax=Alteribacillus sp. YIM 98480 TaxID=2606599 RepID=UPI00131B068C|nr:PaaI family thioesterase [Alteribacillus sp. YIM 98480]